MWVQFPPNSPIERKFMNISKNMQVIRFDRFKNSEELFDGFRKHMASFGHCTYYEWDPRYEATEEEFGKESAEWHNEINSWLKKIQSRYEKRSSNLSRLVGSYGLSLLFNGNA
jgi:hypothetical protein